MPEPISSSGPLASSSYDHSLDEEGQVCRSEPPNGTSSTSQATTSASEPSPAVSKLVSAVPAPPTTLPAPPPSSARNNAERTSERALAPYASAGRVGGTYGLYAGVAMLKGRDPKSGLDVEVLSASRQIGTQNEWQLGLVRVGKSTPAGSVGVEAVTARVNAGIHNDDGSVGLNFSAQATALGGETTLGSATSATAGASLGAGAGGSIGLRDIDKDGNSEICAKVSYGPITVGGCVELPF